jgi:flagellar biosynthesis protein FliR
MMLVLDDAPPTVIVYLHVHTIMGTLTQSTTQLQVHAQSVNPTIAGAAAARYSEILQ